MALRRGARAALKLLQEPFIGSEASAFAGASGLSARATVTNGWRASASSLPGSLYAAAGMRPMSNGWRNRLGRPCMDTEPAGPIGNKSDRLPYDLEIAEMNSPAPDIHAGAVIGGREIGEVFLSEDFKGKWVVLLFYPKAWTFVCPTEILAFSDRHREFEAINAQVVGLSTDTEETLLAWCNHPRRDGGLGRVNIPLVADPTRAISSAYGVLCEKAGVAYRGLFIIDPEFKVRQISITDMPIGRSVDETLRLIQALQFVAEHGEVCPADWTPGEATMKADPEGSKEYFRKEHEGEGREVAPGISAVKTPEEFDSAISSGATVVDFYAPWCGKCQQIGPYVEKLKESYPNVKFVKVDTDSAAMKPIAERLGVTALPAFRFFKDGKEVHDPVTGYKKSLLEAAVKTM